MYARVIYGARWTLLVGVAASLLTVLIGAFFGILAGYFGGWVDGLLSRIGEVFFGLPFVLGAIVILNLVRNAADPRRAADRRRGGGVRSRCCRGRWPCASCGRRRSRRSSRTT